VRQGNNSGKDIEIVQTKDSLGDRMKGYEACYDQVLPRRLPMMIRVDGRGFHTLVRRWGCKKPFDEALMLTMVETAQTLCIEIAGAQLAYVQSDEITVVVRDDQELDTQPWFGKRLNKVVSMAAATATMAFNNRMHKHVPEWHALDTFRHPAVFDARAWVLPEYEVANNLIWRQQDASRNSLQMLARSLYSHKQLQNKDSVALHDLCFAKGQNWNNLPVWQRRGICIVKRPVLKMSKGIVVTRNQWLPDFDIPIFTEQPEYIKERVL